MTKQATRRKSPERAVLSQPLVKLFISHKHEDGEAARKIAAVLRSFGDGRLQVFLSEELPLGTEWLPTLHQELEKADWLVLLYTDPEQEWNWCLYEIGFFKGRKGPSAGKNAIVFHDESVIPPGPLDNFETAPVSPMHRYAVEKFLQELFTESVRPGVAPLFPHFFEELKRPAEVEELIIQSVCFPRERKGFAKEIRLQVPEDALKTKGPVLPDAFVFGNALELFTLEENKNGVPWSTFAETLRRSDNTHDWLLTLTDLIRRVVVSPNRISSTGLPLLRCQDEGRSRVYRPAIRSYAKKHNLLTFRIIFVDLPESLDEGRIGAEVALAHSLALSRTMRWSVLQPLTEWLHRLRSSGSAQRSALAEGLDRFFNQFSGVYAENKNRGYGRDHVQNVFSESDQLQLQKIYRDWDLAFAELRALEDEFDDPGRSTEDVGHRDFDRIDVLVEMMLMINKEFLVLCTKKYSDVVARL